MTLRLAALTSAMLLLATGTATAQDNKPTDPQIAHIAYTAGQIDIEAGKLALKKSKNKQVRDFAQYFQTAVTRAVVDVDDFR